MTPDPSSNDLLVLRLHHYKYSYHGERLRTRLIEDGFDVGEVNAALQALSAATGSDVYGLGVPEPTRSTTDPLAVTATVATAALVSIVTGVLPWGLVWEGGVFWLWLPFAALNVLIALGLYLYVRTRYDQPNVSRGIGIGMAVGAILFFVVMVLVVESVSATAGPQ